jgi:hypothetical protein
MGAGKSVETYKPSIDKDSVLCNNIRDILDMRIKVAKKQPVKNVMVQFPYNQYISKYYKNKLIRMDVYVYIAHEIISKISRTEIHYTKALYDLAEVSHTCNGVIKIVNDNILDKNGKTTGKTELCFYILSRKKRIPFSDITNVYLNVYFIDKFIEQYNSDKCDFMSIGLSMIPSSGDGHYNMFLVLKDKQNNRVYFMLYEPHGSSGKIYSYNSEIKMLKEKFFEFMEKIFTLKFPNTEIIIVDSSEISCPTGLQSNMKDKIGYCEIISIFWLYILLRLMKLYGTDTDSKIKLLLNLRHLEECIYYLADPDTLYSTTVYFAYEFITKFYSSYFLIKDKKPHDMYGYNPHYNEFLFEFEFSYEKILKELEDGGRKREFFVNRKPTKKFERQGTIKTKDIDGFSRKKDGAECKTNSDCLSHRCRNNKCEPYNFDVDRQDSSDSDSDSSHSDIETDNSTDSDSSTDDDDYYDIRKLFYGKRVLGKTKDRISGKNKIK